MAIRITNAIFAHIPKTGGTFITQYFKEANMIVRDDFIETWAHLRGSSLMGISKSVKLSFCFVRHPLTWYRSFWELRQVIPGRLEPIIDDYVDLPFREFINEMAKYPGWLNNYFQAWTDHCGFIGKQENLREDLNTVLHYLRIPYDRELIYKKPNENVMSYTGRATIETYTEELAQAVMQSESVIINQYGYNYIPEGVIDYESSNTGIISI